MNFDEISKEELEHKAREIRARKVEECAARLLAGVAIIALVLLVQCATEAA